MQKNEYILSIIGGEFQGAGGARHPQQNSQGVPHPRRNRAVNLTLLYELFRRITEYRRAYYSAWYFIVTS